MRIEMTVILNFPKRNPRAAQSWKIACDFLSVQLIVSSIGFFCKRKFQSMCASQDVDINSLPTNRNKLCKNLYCFFYLN